MKIKTQLLLIIIINVLLLVGFLSTNLMWERLTERQYRQQTRIMELNQTILERVPLREDFLRHREGRSKEQFLLAHRKIGAMLARLSETFTSPEERLHLTSMIGFHNKTGDLFSQLIRLDEQVTVRMAAMPDIRERIIIQMLINSQALYREGFKLLSLENKRTENKSEIFGLLSSIFFGLLVIFIVVFALIILRRITYPLAKLQEGMKIVAGGNLAYRSDIKTRNEFGMLSYDFDRMTEKLKETTVSRNELEEAVGLRRQEEMIRFGISSRLEALLASIPDIIMEVDQNKVYTWANRPGLAFFGPDVIGKEAAFYFEGEQDTYGIVEPIFNSDDRVVYVESRQRRRDGEKRLLAWWCRSIKDEGGNIISILSSARDITEQSQMQGALMESERRLSEIIDFLPDATFVVDQQGRVIAWNRAIEEMTGIGKEEMIGQGDHAVTIPFYGERRKHLVDLLDVRDRELEAKYQHVRRKGDILSAEAFTPALFGGKGAHLFVTARALLDGQGNRVGAIESIRDITDRKQVEEALRESEAKYRDIFENSIAGIYQSTTEGRYRSVNPALVSMLGYPSAEEMIAQVTDIAAQIFVNPADRERMKAALDERGYFKGFEAEVRRKDGTTFFISNNARAVRDKKGAILYYEGSNMDITARKQAEEEIRKLNAELEARVLERTAQLENANRELEAFSYSVSHDLRAPLRAIDGFSRIVLEDYGDKLDEEGNRLLNVIRTNTRQMDQLITGLLSLSRVTKGELKVARVDMTVMADSVYREIVPPDVQEKFVFTVGALPAVQGDPTLLRQVWGNLIANAMKFTLPQDERRIEITGRREGDMNVYAVKDTGVGFNPAYTHKLFGVFQRLHKLPDFEGNGVGLAIVQRIILHHQGRVWAEGNVNEGATFSFSLPRRG